jgi:protein SCO1/2
MTSIPANHAWIGAARTASLGALLPLLAGTAAAQGEGHPVTSIEVRQSASSMEDRIGATLDLQLEFVDERGYPFKFQQLFPGKSPVILVLGYYGCPDMCGQVIHGMVEALNDVDLQPVQDYLIVNVSIDPRETAATARDRKARFVGRLAKVGCDEGWRFLTGAEAAIQQLAASVGFRYFWAEHDNRFDHPPALLFVTPQGKLSRVITGTTFEPSDVRLAIVEAGEGKIGTFWDKVQLSCLTWDPKTRTYSLAAMTVMRIGGIVTLVAIAAMILTMIRRERRARAAATSLPTRAPATT